MNTQSGQVNSSVPKWKTMWQNFPKVSLACGGRVWDSDLDWKQFSELCSDFSDYSDYNDYNSYNNYRDSDLDLDLEWFSDFSNTVDYTDKLRNLNHDIEG